MARNKFKYSGYALDKFELPLQLRTELREARDRHIEACNRREARAQKARESRRTLLGDKPAPRTSAPTPPERPADTDERAYVKSFDATDSLAGYERRSADQDELNRNKKAAARMREVGPWRPAVRLPSNWRDNLEALRARFPNFSELLDALRGWFAIAEREASGRKLVATPPVLLAGEPGIGKTMFAEAFARAFNLPLHRVDMASAQTAARLSGSEEHWSNSKPGLVFQILAFGDHGGIANSIVLLDELDKADDGRQHVLGALYSLLESRTAATFTDLAYPQICLDASPMLFFGTVNDANTLPAPILSRMRQFLIPGLDSKGRRVVLRNLAEEVARSLGLEPVPPESVVLDRLEGLAPRKVRQLLQDAFGRALDAGREELLPEDVFVPSHSGLSRRIGFLQEGNS